MFQGQGAASASSTNPDEHDSARAELFRGANQPQSRSKGGVRSADEIRSAYGRSNTRCALPLMLFILASVMSPHTYATSAHAVHALLACSHQDRRQLIASAKADMSVCL